MIFFCQQERDSEFLAKAENAGSLKLCGYVEIAWDRSVEDNGVGDSIDHRALHPGPVNKWWLGGLKTCRIRKWMKKYSACAKVTTTMWGPKQSCEICWVCSARSDARTCVPKIRCLASDSQHQKVVNAYCESKQSLHSFPPFTFFLFIKNHLFPQQRYAVADQNPGTNQLRSPESSGRWGSIGRFSR